VRVCCHATRISVNAHTIQGVYRQHGHLPGAADI
jgi:hypothetical protein